MAVFGLASSEVTAVDMCFSITAVVFKPNELAQRERIQ